MRLPSGDSSGNPEAVSAGCTASVISVDIRLGESYLSIPNKPRTLLRTLHVRPHDRASQGRRRAGALGVEEARASGREGVRDGARGDGRQGRREEGGEGADDGSRRLRTGPGRRLRGCVPGSRGSGEWRDAPIREGDVEARHGAGEAGGAEKAVGRAKGGGRDQEETGGTKEVGRSRRPRQTRTHRGAARAAGDEGAGARPAKRVRQTDHRGAALPRGRDRARRPENRAPRLSRPARLVLRARHLVPRGAGSHEARAAAAAPRELITATDWTRKGWMRS